MGAGSGAFSTDDTIVAIATPRGRGAIGIVRLSGADAHPIAMAMLERCAPLRPRHATLTRVHGYGVWPGDEVITTYFQAPHSYTGEDIIEISGHGSPVAMHAILALSCESGARLARPGEFTLRAYLNGKQDLIQAEAVADLIAAVTPLQARLAFDQLQGTLTARIAAIDATLFGLIARLEASLDFPDEGYHFVDSGSAQRELAPVIKQVEELLVDGRGGRMIREGSEVVIIGRPNSGKSLLFNKLVGVDRAIVTAIEGTTRDLLSEPVDINGLAVLLVDTAGIRITNDPVEAEGVARASRAREVAELEMLIIDRSEPLREEDRRMLASTGERSLIVLNKCDLPAAFDTSAVGASVIVSALTGEGIAELRLAIAAGLMRGRGLRDTATVSNLRHLALLGQALENLRSATRALEQRTPEEFVLSDLHAARSRFDEIVGVRTSDDVLTHIFERFCIGK